MRLIEDWIDGFVEYTSTIQSPVIWRRWAAICVIASALQRKVWMQIAGQEQFCNLYVLFVGSPGTGKSNAIKIGGRQFLAKINSIHLAPDDITEQAFYERLEGAMSSYIRDDLPEVHLSLSAFVDEWAVFVRENDRQFMSFLSKVYDNPEVLEHQTRHSGSNILERPHLTMLGGVTPKQLRERFTDQALEGGFPARVILVYSEGAAQVPAAIKIANQAAPANALHSPAQKAIQKRLLRDLESIHMIAGEYEWTPEAGDTFVKWYDKGMLPAPTDPKLKHYTTRRLSHFTKLVMIVAASRRDERFIEPEDVKAAQDLLLEAEGAMGIAVQGLGSSKHLDALKLARNFIFSEYQRTKKPVLEYRIRQVLIADVEPHMTGFVLDTLVRTHWATRETDGISGVTTYKPILQKQKGPPGEEGLVDEED